MKHNKFVSFQRSEPRGFSGDTNRKSGSRTGRYEVRAAHSELLPASRHLGELERESKVFSLQAAPAAMGTLTCRNSKTNKNREKCEPAAQKCE